MVRTAAAVRQSVAAGPNDAAALPSHVAREAILYSVTVLPNVVEQLYPQEQEG